VTSAFEILAAIDLRGGRVVRLEQGDFDRETVFSDDPVAVARHFVDEGARWLHVVDLDGARSGAPAHLATVRAVIDGVGDRCAVEVAGGLRDAAAVDTMLAVGAARVVLGTVALDDPALVAGLIERHGAIRVAVAVDVRDGRAIGRGWSAEETGVDAPTAIERLAAVGVSTFEVTAIERDGLLGGPDLELYERSVGVGPAAIIASAGISSVADIAGVRRVGCAGAIVGRALYDGRLSLADAIGAAIDPV
jgi:phosphoribosylformimino-5-aminoimidazole carboxamide ribotide isomerase